MKIRRTAHFDRNYTKAPQEIQQVFDKQSLATRNDSPFLGTQQVLVVVRSVMALGLHTLFPGAKPAL
jgi:hypothetical protein